MKLLGLNFDALIARHFRYVLVAVVVLLVGLGYLLFIGPQVSAVRQYGVVDLSAENKRLTDRTDYLSRLEKMLQLYSALNQTDLDRFNRLLPTEADFPDLFVIVEDLVSSSELELNSLSISPGSGTSVTSGETGTAPSEPANPAASLAQRGDLKVLNLAVSVSGGKSYEHFKKFLQNIENSLRLFNIQSLTFAPAQSTQTGRLESTASSAYSINLQTYYLPSADN